MTEQNTAVSFNSQGIKPKKELVPVPAGWYAMAIESAASKLINSAKGNGTQIQLVLRILNGEYENRKIFDNLMIQWDGKPVVQTIGQEQMSAVCYATGVPSITDLSQFYERPMQVKVKEWPDRISDDGKQLNASNEVVNYKKPEGVTVAAPGVPPAPGSVAPPPTPGTPPAAPGTPPPPPVSAPAAPKPVTVAPTLPPPPVPTVFTPPAPWVVHPQSPTHYYDPSNPTVFKTEAELQALLPPPVTPVPAAPVPAAPAPPQAAPPAAVFPPAGWVIHPDTAGYYWNQATGEVLSDADLRAKGSAAPDPNAPWNA